MQFSLPSLPSCKFFFSFLWSSLQISIVLVLEIVDGWSCINGNAVVFAFSLEVFLVFHDFRWGDFLERGVLIGEWGNGDVWLPNHNLKLKVFRGIRVGLTFQLSYVSIFASSDKIFTVLAEFYSSHTVLMTLECENIATFEQVEHFCETIFRSGDHEVTRRMKIEAGDARVEDSVILDQFTHLQVEDFHSSIFLGYSDDITVEVPGQLISIAFFVLERVNNFARICVKDFQGFVFSAGSDHAIVRWKASTPDPVGVSRVWFDEVAMRQPPHFNWFIIAGGDQPIPWIREVNRSDRILMCYDLLRVAFVHLRLKDIYHFFLAYCRYKVFSAPINFIDFIILFKFQTPSIFLRDRVDGNGAIQWRCCKLILGWTKSKRSDWVLIP